MSQREMKDVIVVLPGVMGSVLQKGGSDLWAVSGWSILRAIRTLGGDLERMLVGDDDPEADDLGDQIKATALMDDTVIVPGFYKVEGYSKLTRMIKRNFVVIPGTLDDEAPANFYEFPYDWRRDNRVAARRLKRLVERQLPIWRAHTGDPDAKVIIIAHSMGGLVARHYLEVLEGWPDCRMLVTLGTPYRGSVKSLNYLVNGFSKLRVDLTDAIRSFTSIYQLLPIYQVVKTEGGYRRVAEMDGLPNVDKKRAAEARKFHLDIVEKVEAHSKDETYRKNFQTIPIVGVWQPTLQSGELTVDGGASRLVTGETLPDIDGLPGDGDGTVPYTSAVPYEFSGQFRDCTFVEQHGSLQGNDRVLDYLLNLLRRARSGAGLLQALGPEKEDSGIRLRVEDLYLPGEPVELRADIVNPVIYPDALDALIESSDGLTVRRTPFRFDGERWVLVEENLPPGVYRAEVRAPDAAEDDVKPVHGLFEVWGGEAIP